MRKIHNGVSQLQNQCHLTTAMLMDFWIVLMKAKKMDNQKIDMKEIQKNKLKCRKGKGISENYSHEKPII